MPTVPAKPETLHLLRLVAAPPTDPDAEDAINALLPGELRRWLFASDLSAEQQAYLENRLPPGRVWRMLKPSLGSLLAFAQVLAEDALAGDAASLTELAEFLDISAERAQALVSKHRESRDRLLDGPTVAARGVVAEVVGLRERNLRRYVDRALAGKRLGRSEARQWIARRRRWRTPVPK